MTDATDNEGVKKKDATNKTYTGHLMPLGLTVPTRDLPVHMNNSQNPVAKPGTQVGIVALRL